MHALRLLSFHALKHVALLALGALSLCVMFVAMLTVLGLIVWAIVQATVPPDLIHEAVAIIPARFLEEGRLFAIVCLVASVLWLSWGTGADVMRSFGAAAGPSDRGAGDRSVLRIARRQLSRTVLGALAVLVTGAGLCAAALGLMTAALWALAPDFASQLAERAAANGQLTPLVIFGGGCLGICGLWLCWSVGYGLEIR